LRELSRELRDTASWHRNRDFPSLLWNAARLGNLKRRAVGGLGTPVVQGPNGSRTGYQEKQIHPHSTESKFPKRPGNGHIASLSPRLITQVAGSNPAPAVTYTKNPKVGTGGLNISLAKHGLNGNRFVNVGTDVFTK
jgi:hypothetical protein